MSKIDPDLLAAEYVLGTLDDKRRRLVDWRRSDDRALGERIDVWERRLTLLNDDVQPVSPPASVWDRIEAALGDGAAAEPLLTVRATEAAWEPVAPGIDRRTLYLDAETGWQSYLLRFAPGTRLPPHRHQRTEECLLLEGDLSIGSLRLGAGDFHLATAGSLHPEITSEGGAVAYIRGELYEAEERRP